MAKKYIDTDEFMHRMYNRAFETDGDTMWQSGCWVRYRAIEAVVQESPAADVVEVCRCEHCPKSTEHPNGRWCKLHQSVVQNSDYCSWGTKR